MRNHILPNSVGLNKPLWRVGAWPGRQPQVREHLKLKPGDKLDFVIESDGRVVIRPAKLDVREPKGLLKRRDGKVLSIEEMNAAIARGAAGKR